MLFRSIVYLTDYILDHMDRQMSTGAVFIDLKKAFDLVDHECLLYKLEHYGVEEAVWIGSETVLRHEHKEYFLGSTCLPADPSSLVFRTAQF